MSAFYAPTRWLNEEAQRDRRFGLVTLVLRASASRPPGEWNDDYLV
jgi:hypothetical protein